MDPKLRQQIESTKELRRLGKIAAKEFGEKTEAGFLREKAHPCRLCGVVVNQWCEERGEYVFLVCLNCNWVQKHKRARALFIKGVLQQ